MSHRHMIFVLSFLLAVWSTAAIAQSLDAASGLPSELLGAGQGISWPVALVVCAYIAAREARYMVDALVRESFAWRERKAGSVKITASLCDRRDSDRDDEKDS